MSDPSMAAIGRPYVFVPMETKNREFFGKLLVACHAAESGFRVILCEQQELRRLVHRFPPGVYLDKSIVATKRPLFRYLRALGHRVTAWCEEGLVYRHRDTYLAQRIDGESFGQVDRFFTWGVAQAADVASKIPEAPLKTVATGNPRFDLLRPPYRALFQAEAERYRGEFGPFVLINTNFSRYNHFYSPEHQLKRWKLRGRIRTAEEEKFYWEWSEFIGRVFHQFLDMTREIARRLAPTVIVIRPHPSENHDVWRREMEGIANVCVRHEGPVLPWILGSQVLVHNSCTTGIEAFLLGKPVVAYRPVTSPKFDAGLPNDVSINVSSIDSLADLLRQIVATGEEPAGVDRTERQALVTRYVTNAEGALASERIVSELTQVAGLLPPPVRGLSRAAWNCWIEVQNRTRETRRWLVRQVRGGKTHAEQKFPGLTIAEMQDAIGRLRDVAGRFRGVEVSPVPEMRKGFEMAQKQRPESTGDVHM